MVTDYDVAIIGAGAAGIAAARRLHAAGCTVILIEAASRVGGRASTVGYRGMPLDMGCGWLHSARRNPLVPVGEEAGFTIVRGRSAWESQWRDLGFSQSEQEAAGASWERLQHRLRSAPPEGDRASDLLEDDDPWNAYCQSLSGYLNGATLDRISIRDFLAYDEAATEDNWRVQEGYGSLIASALPTTIAMRLSTPVRRVALTTGGLRLETAQGSLTAATVIVTVSTAVLARGAIAFDTFVNGHLEAASQLPLGLADKLFLELHGDHGLEAETHLLGNPHSAETGSYYIRPLGRPVIEGFFGGSGAVRLEEEGLLDAFAFALEELARLVGSGITRHLRPLAASSWCATDWVHGSYSHALPGCAAARAGLAAPVEGRLFFAGEATHDTDFSTAHGAWQTGLRAADEALAALGRRDVGAGV